MTVETQARLKKLSADVWYKKTIFDKAKSAYEDAKKALTAFMGRNKVDAVESESGTLSRVVPSRKSVDKEKLAKKLPYADYVAISTVSLTALAAIMSEEEITKYTVEEQGAPYLKPTPKSE